MRAAARYRDLLQDDRTFATYTIEELLQSGVIPDATTVPFRERYR